MVYNESSSVVKNLKEIAYDAQNIFRAFFRLYQYRRKRGRSSQNVQ